MTTTALTSPAAAGPGGVLASTQAPHIACALEPACVGVLIAGQVVAVEFLEAAALHDALRVLDSANRADGTTTPNVRDVATALRKCAANLAQGVEAFSSGAPVVKVPGSKRQIDLTPRRRESIQVVEALDAIAAQGKELGGFKMIQEAMGMDVADLNNKLVNLMSTCALLMFPVPACRGYVGMEQACVRAFSWTDLHFAFVCERLNPLQNALVDRGRSAIRRHRQ
jgi:hypothetical protein